jgi:8-oxo-dGTP diphosphatase
VKTIQVTCLVLLHQGKVLATQRSATMDLPGYWEFPGGKMEPEESPTNCLIREISEELSIGIRISRPLTPVLHTYPNKSIQLIPFLATWESGTLQLTEHAQIQWLAQKDLLSLDWAPADIPILHELNENWDYFFGLT